MMERGKEMVGLDKGLFVECKKILEQLSTAAKEAQVESNEMIITSF